MKKKIILSLVYGLLSLGIATGCNSSEQSVKNDKTINSTIEENVVAADDYTRLEILGANVKFKLANPTYLWNCEDNFHSLEIDTVFIISKNGQAVEDYYNAESISGISFLITDDTVLSESSLKKEYKTKYGVDITVEDMEHDLYKRHLKGESSKLYFESYAFEYEGVFEEEESGTIYYSIQLIIHKDDYTKEEIDRVIKEYHIIIDTFEFIK